MRKELTTICLLFAVCAVSSAQNLKETITIDNEFESSLSHTEKQTLPFSVPDSVRKFDYKFDYSIFDTPYKGAYEFSPYRTRMTVRPEQEKISRLYLNAGAGYNLYPEFQAIWRPKISDRISLTIRQDFNGYYGNYRSVRNDIKQKAPLYTNAGMRQLGYDLYENFGADFRLGTKAGSLSFSADYHGIFNEDESVHNSLNAVGVILGYSLKDFVNCPVDAEIYLKNVYSKDAISHPYSPQAVYENDFSVYGLIGPRLNGKLQVHADYEFRYFLHSYGYSRNWAEGNFIPYGEYAVGAFKFRLGVGLFFTDKVYVRPDVKVDVKLWNGILNPYLSVTGGARTESYFELRSDNHWFAPSYTPDLQTTVENIRATLGFHGSISRFFEYDVRGGYLSISSDAMTGLRVTDNTLHSALVYQDYSAGFVDARLSWKSKSVEADGTLSFVKTDILSRGLASAGLSALDLPVFSVDLRAVYNYRKRIFAEVNVRTATNRNSCLYDIEKNRISQSAYFNLGVRLEYRFNKNWSVWVKGLNLLDECIQADPFHVESGISGTAGFVLNF